MLFLGLGGGFIAGALGLGGGVLFNPLLLSMGVPPMVSKATSLYLITFSKVITCIVYFIVAIVCYCLLLFCHQLHCENS